MTTKFNLKHHQGPSFGFAKLRFSVRRSPLGYLVGSIKINAVGGWRDMYRLSASIAVLMGLSMFSLPPSPRWLLLRAIQGKASVQEYKEKTIQGLSKLRGRPSGDKVSQKQIEDTPISLKSAYAADDSEGSFWECFKALV